MFKTIVGWKDARSRELENILQAVQEARQENRKALDDLMAELTGVDSKRKSDERS
jgi:hypothetical protein